MYLYKIGYTGYEDNHYIEMMHEQKLTHDELMDMVAEAMLPSYLSDLAWNEEQQHHGSKYNPWLSSCMGDPKFIPAMEKLGFKLVQYDGVLTFWGMTEIAESHQCRHHGDPNETDLALVKRVIRGAKDHHEE